MARMMGKSWLLAGLLLLAGVNLARANDVPSMADAPAWTRTDSLPVASGRDPGGKGTRYQLVSDQLDLTGKQPQWYRRIVYTVRRQSDLGDAGQLSIDYQPDYQSLVLNGLDVWRGGKRLDLRKRAHYARLRREGELEDGLLDGAATLSITLPDLRVGDRVDYRFTVIGANPVFGHGYYDQYAARYGVPVGLRRLYVRYPVTMPLRWRVTVPGFTVTPAGEGSVATVDIRAAHVPAVEDEDDAPEGYDVGGRIELSTAHDWGEVARWATSLYPQRFSDARVADAIARQLHLDPGDPRGSLMRATAFVQGEVRYLGLDMGANSHEPHSPEQTLRNRYGDCKDKATLLVALLERAGIAAEPVLVDADEGSDPAAGLPSPLAFDHVVVRAHLAGSDVWVDATRDREDGPLADRQPLGFGRGLPVLAGQQSLVDIPDPLPRRPELDVRENVDVSMGTLRSARFDIATEYRHGYAADVRAQFEDEGAESMGQSYLKYMRSFYRTMQADGVPRIDDPASTASFGTHELYRLHWRRGAGDVLDLPLFQLQDWMDVPSKEVRHAPLVLDGPRYARQTVRLHVDAPVEVADGRREVINPWFRFVRTVRREGGTVVVTGEWFRLAPSIPAQQLRRAAHDMQLARNLVFYNLDLDRRPAPALFKSTALDWVLPVVSLLAGLALATLAIWGAWRGNVLGMLYLPERIGGRLVKCRRRRAIAWLVFIAASGLWWLARTGGHGDVAHGAAATVLWVAGGIAINLVKLVLAAVLVRLALRVLGT